MAAPPPIREFSAVILGAGGVGKSALTLRFMKGYFHEAYDPTIEETYRRNVVLDDETSRVSRFLLPYFPPSTASPLPSVQPPPRKITSGVVQGNSDSPEQPFLIAPTVNSS
ncbi:SubName: Full=Uncharacterized protein {ECO:0000313/EMBL:CCA73828.1} [Serendipita indica DSM 11827]|uniref:Uncharacterized protein n=1 Tax=Serendipita indica (strain DSM 11827) TaxID=1109443 RepID=G4TR85_SERID|nr:SubName: Full=Uncharacterized protein {ECO:0000313/EMBL:CCA73828.1} [Serendipita indica DSM 11827]CCA73828.1 hypothetical protein PIIN_07782 [Serendipita indica DSM 11827]